MDKACKNCKYMTSLKHNFTVGKGLEDSFCCTIFAKEKNGFVLQVELNDICEMYKKGNEENGNEENAV